MQRTTYYKTFHLGDQKHTVTMSRPMDNDEFLNKLLYIRRLFGYAMYPRWFAIRMFLGDVFEMLKKNNLWKHKVKKAANILIKEFDAYEKMHTSDFDEEWIEVMASTMTESVLPKINELRGCIGGVLMNNGIKHYVLYSYPETVCILANEGVVHHDMLMQEVREGYKMDLKEVFKPLRGLKVLASAYSLMSAIEDAIGEPLPMGVDARGTGADEKLKTLERILVNDDLLRKAVADAADEVGAWEQDTDELAEKLSEKFNVKRL